MLSKLLKYEMCIRDRSGTFPCGGRLPPVREMAAEAGVNPNTMQRALAELERTGLVYTQRTAGRFVTEDAAVVDSAKQELAHQQIGAFLHRMERMGYDREQTAQLVRSWDCLLYTSRCV